MKRLLPSPFLSLGIFLGWLLLNQSLSTGQIVMGVLVALIMPALMAPLRPTPGRLRRPWLLVPLVLRVGRDVVRSAIQVARGVMRARRHPPRARFVHIPLDLHDAHGLAALSMITAVVPGTVWCELSPDHTVLLLHVFDVEDDETFIAHYKRDYERPLVEVFQ